MTNHTRRQMPVYGNDHAAYLQEMYQWHMELSLEPGKEGSYHLSRVDDYRQMLEADTDTQNMSYF